MCFAIYSAIDHSQTVEDLKKKVKTLVKALDRIRVTKKVEATCKRLEKQLQKATEAGNNAREEADRLRAAVAEVRH